MTEADNAPLSTEESRRIQALAGSLEEMLGELGRRIIGQEDVIRQILAAVLSEGHALLVGVPGLAKTLMIQSLAELLSLSFKRIQFTPDLMPADITGATLIRSDQEGRREFHFLRGPIFCNILLADEINRTPPKTQAALMEAMEEGQVTAGGRRVPIDRPFFVLATQNPIEQEGTYPLPISQLDRFLIKVYVDYPTSAEEFQVVQRTTSTYESKLEPRLSHEEITEMLGLVRRIEMPSTLMVYASKIVRSTRPTAEEAPDFVRESIAWGAGPRAVQGLIAGARAMAFLAGRGQATEDDMHSIVHAVLRHRLILNYHAEAEGASTDDLVDQVLVSLGRYTPPERKSSTKPKKGLLARWLSKS